MIAGSALLAPLVKLYTTVFEGILFDLGWGRLNIEANAAEYVTVKRP